MEPNITSLNSDEEDEDEDVKRWKIKKRLEAKKEEEARQRALRARGNFSTCKMLLLAVQVRVYLSHCRAVSAQSHSAVHSVR